MATDRAMRHDEVRRSLRRLDLYYHSLRLVGERLVAQVGDSAVNPSDALYERSLQLSEESLRVLRGMTEYLNEQDVDLLASAVNQVDLALRRASQAGKHTMHMVNVWRVIEVTDDFVARIAGDYGYERLSEAVPVETTERDDKIADEVMELFADYEDAMATKTERRESAVPPFSHGVVRWRGSQLFYVQRTEDRARWIELDTNFEKRGVTEEEGGVETSEARTIDGFPITLTVDLDVDENQVDVYLRSQWGRERYASGYEIAAELAGKMKRAGGTADKSSPGVDDSSSFTP